MPKDSLNPAQLQRSDQLYFTHKALSAINSAAKDAAKQHDKYVASMEKVIAAILDNSDCVEETRKLFGPQGESSIAPTFEVTGRLSDAFRAWLASAELKRLREDLDAIEDLSSTAKRSVKIAEKSSTDLEKAAQKAAKFNTDKQQRKIGNAQTSRQKRLKTQQDEANAQVQTMDNAVVESMLSLGQWWSNKLVAISDGLYSSIAEVSAAATRIFPSFPAATRPHHAALSMQRHEHPFAEPTLTASQNHRITTHTDPNVPSSPSAPSSSVNSRQQQTHGLGIPFLRGSSNGLVGVASAATPPPLFANAAAAAAVDATPSTRTAAAQAAAAAATTAQGAGERGSVAVNAQNEEAARSNHGDANGNVPTAARSQVAGTALQFTTGEQSQPQCRAA